MEQLELHCEIREKTTKSQLKHYRKQRYIPAVSYGEKEKNQLLWIKYKSILELIKKTKNIEGVILNLKIKDKTYPAIIKEIQRDVVSNKPIHIDFQIISMKEKVELKIPVKLKNEEQVLKLTGGIIDFPLRELKIKCLPKDVPQYIELDIGNLKIGDAIYVKDIPQKNFTISENPDAIVVHILSKKVEEVTVTPETVTGQPQEPEVIAKGKKVEETTTE